MVRFMKVSGRQERGRGLEFGGIPTVIATKVSG